MRMAKPTQLALQLLAAMLLGLAPPAQALPFDPLPSAFERWLNSQRNWAAGARLRFSRLADCSDQSAASSPYRLPVYTCLEGELRRSGGGQPSQVCRLKRVSYFPSMGRVRYWSDGCTASG